MRSSSLRYVLAIALVVAGCERERPLPPGLGAPIADHTLRVITDGGARLAPGTKLRLRSYRGRPVVIDFWASWCGPCLRMHEHMVALAERYAPKGVAFIGVVFQDEPDRAARWLDEHGTNFVAVEDLDGALARTFWVNAIPRAIVVGPDGRLVDDRLSSDDLPGVFAQRLDSLLAAGPPG